MPIPGNNTHYIYVTLTVGYFIASEAKRRRRRRLRGAEQAHSHVMGSENSALTPKILIFRKNGTDEKSLIFGCRIHI